MAASVPPSTVRFFEEKKVTISTPRLFLRTAIEDDVSGLHEAFSDPEVMRYW
jgi:hypothetical protein